MPRIQLILLLLIALLADACKPDPPQYIKKAIAQDPPLQSNFLPLTKNNYWRYLYRVTGAGSDTITINITGSHAIVNGSDFYECQSLTKSQLTATGYFCDAPPVYVVQQAATVQGATAIIEIQMLNDAVSPGKTWISDLSPDGKVNGIPARMIGTVIEKNVGVVLGNLSFTGVIHTRVDLQFDFGAGYQTFSTYNYYMADNVGIIRITSGLGDDVVTDQILIDYLAR